MLHRLRPSFSLACIALAFAGCRFAPEATSPADEAPLAVSAAVSPGAYQLKAVHSGKCIELPGASTANGTKLKQATCTGAPQQQWKLRFVSGDIWEAVSAASGKCADVTGISTANGALIQQWDCAGSGNQRWHMIDMGSGQYEFKAVHSNRCLDIAAWSTADGAAVQQWDCHGGGNQKFIPVPVIAPPTSAPACKRGYAYGGNSAADLQAMAKAVSWWYNWSPRPEAGAASVYASAGVEFVPMVWGGGNFITTASTSIPAGAKYLLAFNEPNFGSQSNLTAQQAASLWPQIESIAAKYNLKIVSPATNFCGGNCNNTDPYNWLKDFFAACPNCKVDYIASHWYACDGPALTWHLNNLKQFGKPIWLTEFSCLDGADKSLAVQQAYMNAALGILENDPMVFRYAWFTGRFPDVPSINLLGSSGQLTALGTQYVNYPQACKAR
jgi:hypothetical protein